MLKNIVLYVVLSLTIILGFHYLYTFLKSNLTTPKVIDLVKKPDEEYKKIYDKIQTNTEINSDTEIAKRKEELKKYMKELSDNSEDTVKIKNAESNPNHMPANGMQTNDIQTNGMQTNGKEDELNVESYNIDSQPSFSTF